MARNNSKKNSNNNSDKWKNKMDKASEFANNALDLGIKAGKVIGPIIEAYVLYQTKKKNK